MQCGVREGETDHAPPLCKFNVSLDEGTAGKSSGGKFLFPVGGFFFLYANSL